MTFDHPLRGTCNDESCPSHGLCHCGCGGKTRVPERNWFSDGWHRGRPGTWVKGHNLRGRARPKGSGGLMWARRGIPVERLQPLLEWLVSRYGFRGAGRVLNWEIQYIWRLRTSRIKKVSPPKAQHLVDTVLAHKRRPVDPFSTWEVELREATPEEREVDESRLDQRRMERDRARQRRAGKRSNKCQGGCGLTIASNALDQEVCRKCRETAMPYHCATCDKGAASSHALYLHSMQVHGDKTQGKHSWAGKAMTG